MNIFSAMFPPKCPVCRKISREGKKGVCISCRTEFDRLYCPRAVLNVENAEFCTAVFPYDSESVRSIIFRLKERSPQKLIDFASEYLAKAVFQNDSLSKATLVTYVPRRRAAVRANGVDQAKYLAESLADRLGLPCRTLLTVTRKSQRQHSLGRTERRRNVRGLYAAREKLPYDSVILIDDIVTTGATASEAAKVLKKSGADSVYVLSLAH